MLEGELSGLIGKTAGTWSIRCLLVRVPSPDPAVLSVRLLVILTPMFTVIAPVVRNIPVKSGCFSHESIDVLKVSSGE